MKGYVLYFFIFLLSTGCNNIRNNVWEPYDESYEIKSNEIIQLKECSLNLFNQSLTIKIIG